MRIHCNWRYLYVIARFFKGKSEPPTITLGGTLWGGHVVRWGVNLNETTSFGDLGHIIKNIQKPNLKPNFEFDHQEIWTSTPFCVFPTLSGRHPTLALFVRAKCRGQCHLQAMDGKMAMVP